jgi:hypothetical protein
VCVCVCVCVCVFEWYRSDVVCVSAFANVVQGKKEQGTYMGLITTCGSLGRITFPLLVQIMAAESALLVCAILSIASTLALLSYQLVILRLHVQQPP